MESDQVASLLSERVSLYLAKLPKPGRQKEGARLLADCLQLIRLYEFLQASPAISYTYIAPGSKLAVVVSTRGEQLSQSISTSVQAQLVSGEHGLGGSHGH